MRSFEVSDSLRKELKRLSKKDSSRYRAVLKKIEEIIRCQDVSHYKNLRKPLQHLKRVHIDGSFVLAFEHSMSEDTVRFISLDHHDDAYR